MSQEGAGAGGRAQPSVAVLAQALRCKCAADAQGGGQASLEKGLGPPGSEEGRASARPPTRRWAARPATYFRVWGVFFFEASNAAEHIKNSKHPKSLDVKTRVSSRKHPKQRGSRTPVFNASQFRNANQIKMKETLRGLGQK